MNQNKPKLIKEITPIIKKLKKSGKKIVAYSGTFDILHVGHILSIQEAKKQGDILIILLNSDKSIRKYKGPQRPINCQVDRVKILSVLSAVDYIVIFNELTPNKILSKIKPDIYCVGTDWGRGNIERRIVEENNGKIHILKNIKGGSSSKIIQKILKQYRKPVVKAIFLDRDGVINKNEPEYLYKIKDFKFLPGVMRGFKKLSKTKFKIIIITNQSGIARGYFTENDLKKLHNWVLNLLKMKGVGIDKVYYCPHHPDFGDEKYRKKCNCRKPNLGLVQKAVEDFKISLNDSWLIGDDTRDILMGRTANLKTIFIGKNQKEFNKLKILPHYFAKNFLEAINIILKNS